MKSNKSISRFFFDQIPFFAISKMAKNQFLTGKMFKMAKKSLQKFSWKILKKFFREIDFLPGFFLIFWPAVKLNVLLNNKCIVS